MSTLYNTPGSMPPLRPNCNANVQFAFQEGRWAQSITYAKQQFKATHDPYYEAVEIAIRSQLDNTGDQLAAFVTVEKLLADSKSVKDYWILELYDWAYSRVHKNYSQTVGALRAGFVKDVWKPDSDKAVAAARSFYACAINNDWENAQKIAALLDQKFPKEPRHQFYNILSYYVFSNQLPANDPKRTMFRTLSTRLIDKALQLRDSTPVTADFSPRAIISEDELLLWLRIRINCAKDDAEIRDLLRKPEFSALKRLSEGSVSVFKEIMSLLEKHELWEDLFSISQELFDQGLAYLVDDADGSLGDIAPAEDEIHERMQNILSFTTVRAQELGEAKKEAESRAFQTAVMDWSLWKQFIAAASHLKTDKKAQKQLHGFMNKVSKVKRVLPIYRKQIEISDLLILFNRYDLSTAADTDASSATYNTRVEHLVSYVVSNYKLVSCFEDLKPYLEQLSFEEIKIMLDRLNAEGGKSQNDAFKNMMILTLRLRFRYLFATSMHSLKAVNGRAYPECNFCGVTVEVGSCRKCLGSLTKSCVWIYNQEFQGKDLRTHIDSEDVDPFADLAIVGATCLLKLSGLTSGRQNNDSSSTPGVNLKLIIQAISWLNAHYSRVAQKDAAIPVYLTKLYLLIGCISQAQSLWDALGVKNVTLDSLGPLFSDRLSSIAPGMWQAGKSTPMNRYHRFYRDAIHKTIPVNIRTSLELANYPSVLGLLDTQRRLSQSCTMIITNVEDRRGLRAIGSKAPFDTKDDVLLRLVDLEKELVNASDYVALPNHECAPATLADVISIGPGLSDTRARLSLFTEDFISLISYKEPKEYKPIKPLQVAQIDRDLVAQASSQLGERIQGLVMRCLQAYQNPTIKLELTGAELSFFTTVNFLVCFVVSVTKTPLTKSTTRPVRTADIAATIDVEVQNQVQKMQDERDNISDTKTALHQFASLHALGMLRESVQVVKLVVNYLERAALTTKTDVPKWLNEDIKSLNCTASDATATIKQRIKLLNDAANTSGWLDSISEFAFGDLAKGTKTVDTNPKDAESSDLDTMVFQASGQKAGLVNTIGEIKDSWQEVAKGWNTVKFD